MYTVQCLEALLNMRRETQTWKVWQEPVASLWQQIPKLDIALYSVPHLHHVRCGKKTQQASKPMRKSASSASGGLKLGAATLATKCCSETCSTRKCWTTRNGAIANRSVSHAQLAGSARAMSPRTTAQSAANKAILSSQHRCWRTTRAEVDEHS